MIDASATTAARTGIIGGLLFTVLNGMYVASHGLDADPDHRVLLGLSQDAWAVVSFLAYPLLLFTYAHVVRTFWRSGTALSRAALALSAASFVCVSVGHLLQLFGVTGAPGDAHVGFMGWMLYAVSLMVFGPATVLAAGLAWRRRGDHVPLRWPMLALGLAHGTVFLGAFDHDGGFEWVLPALLLSGLAWMWVGLALLRRNSSPRFAVEA